MTLSDVLFPLFSLILISIHISEGTAVENIPQLYLALEANQTSKAWHLLEQGANPDELVVVNGCNSSLLHLSVYKGESYVTVQLLQMGANFSMQDCNNLTAVNYAILEGKMSLIREIVSAGYDLNWQPMGSDLPLFFAISHNKAAELQGLLELGAALKSVYVGQTPLYVAGKNGALEAAKLLIKNGQVPNETFSDGDTYLHRAARSGDVGGLLLFFDLGLDVDMVNAKGLTPLYFGIITNNPRVINALIFKGANMYKTFDGESYMSLAVKNNLTKALKSLLEHKAPADITDFQGLTLLYNATKDGKVELVRLLLLGGASVSITAPSDQRTPLHVAAESGYLEIARLLLDYGANTEAKSSIGSTPLHLAAWNGETDVAALLLDRGADVNSMNNDEHTPLYIAEKRGKSATAQLLKSRGGISK